MEDYSVQLASIYLKNTSNANNGISNDEFTEKVYFRAIFAGCLLIVLLISVTGGFFVCYVIKIRKLLKKSIWIYLFILAMSDGTTSLFVIPTILAACIDEKVLEIRWVCNLNLISIIFFGSFSIFTLAAISLRKYISISKPFKSLSNSGHRQLVIYLCISFAVCFALSVPPLLGFSRFTHIEGRKWCSLRSGSKLNDSIMLSFIGLCSYFIPLCIILITNIRTFLILKKYNATKTSILRITADEINAENRVILKTLSLVVIVFIILWTPLLVYIIIGITGMDFHPLFVYIAYMLMLLQGSINPIIYYFKHSSFKKVFKKIFRKKAVKQEQTISTFGKEEFCLRNISGRFDANMNHTQVDPKCIK